MISRTKISNITKITKDIRFEAKVKSVSTHMRLRRLEYYGHVRRRRNEDDIRYVIEMKGKSGKRKRGRSKRWR